MRHSENFDFYKILYVRWAILRGMTVYHLLSQLFALCFAITKTSLVEMSVPAQRTVKFFGCIIRIVIFGFCEIPFVFLQLGRIHKVILSKRLVAEKFGPSRETMLERNSTINGKSKKYLFFSMEI